MNIALIGASGQLGTDLKKIIPASSLVELNYPNFDITRKNTIRNALKSSQLDLVINTAAYNLVDQAEKDPAVAKAVNVLGVENLVDICLELDLILVHFSSDYVFGADTTRNAPYTEKDTPGPINQYGLSKLLGEQIIQEKMKKYFLIRTAYLFGAAGSEGKGGNLIESLIAQAEKSGQLRAIDNQLISPTYALDLARQVWQLIQTTHYGLFHAVSEGHCTILDLAEYLFKLLKTPIKIIPAKSSEYKTLARRPHYSVLTNKRLTQLNLNIMRPWQEALTDYLKEKDHLNK